MVFNWSVLALLLLIYVTFFVLFLRKYGKFTKRKHLSVSSTAVTEALPGYPVLCASRHHMHSRSVDVAGVQS